jgi:hypothetical protein
MELKEALIDCPCCAAKLVVDLRTGKVLRARPQGQVDEEGRPKVGEADWTSANERVKTRLNNATDRFDEGLQRERAKSRDLDDLFRKASEKLKGNDGGSGP